MIPFKGLVTTEVLDDLRRIYLRGNGVFRATLCAVGLVLIYIGFGTTQKTAWDYTFNFGMAAVCFLVASFVHRAWWHWWLYQYRPADVPFITGAIADDGLHLANQAIPWNRIVSAKVGSRAILLYIDKSNFHPIHRSMVHSDEAWRQAQAIVVSHVSMLKRYVERESVRTGLA
jgi:hypothetical protein